jgi:hypothetical protein
MMRRLFVLSLFAFVASTHAGPTENTSAGHEKAYGSDDKWWKCNLDFTKGCDTGPLGSLGLTEEEQAFVRGTLDRVPWHPKSATTADVAAVLGSQFSTGFGSQKFLGIGPGSRPERAVMLHFYKGYVHNIKWYVPGRFMLVKDHFFP